MAKEKESFEKKKNTTGASAAFWIAFALILLIVFLVNRDRILSVLQNTGFFGKVFGSDPEFVVNHQSKTEKKPLAEIDVQEQTFVYETEELPASEPEPVTPAVTVPDPVKTEKTEPARTEQVQKKEEPKKTETVTPKREEPAAAAQMEQHLCFIQIAGDGSVVRKEVVRSINKTNMPLTAAINALLKGPDLRDLEAGYMSLIPAGTRLLGASVSNGVATINFSDEFRYNQYGVEGYYGQLMQVVYTATAFGNIESVQFLIEGEKSDYLGSEGVYIGAPLPRSTFR